MRLGPLRAGVCSFHRDTAVLSSTLPSFRGLQLIQGARTLAAHTTTLVSHSLASVRVANQLPLRQ